MVKQPLRLLLLGYLILPALSVYAECVKNPETTLEMKACAAEDYQKADKKLNETYKTILDSLDAEGRRKLVSAEQVWIRYRDLHCDSVADVYRGGTLQGLIHTSCLTRMTEERIKELYQVLEEDRD